LFLSGTVDRRWADFWERGPNKQKNSFGATLLLILLFIRNLDTNKERQKAIQRFLKKVCGIILGPVYDNEKENWRILTNKEMYARVENLL